MSDKNFMRDFSPAWFASVMGTGILATTSMFLRFCFACSPVRSRHSLDIQYCALCGAPVLLDHALDKVPSECRKGSQSPRQFSILPHHAHRLYCAGRQFPANRQAIPVVVCDLYSGEHFLVIGSLITLIFAFLLPSEPLSAPIRSRNTSTQAGLSLPWP